MRRPRKRLAALSPVAVVDCVAGGRGVVAPLEGLADGSNAASTVVVLDQ